MARLFEVRVWPSITATVPVPAPEPIEWRAGERRAVNYHLHPVAAWSDKDVFRRRISRSLLLAGIVLIGGFGFSGLGQERFPTNEPGTAQTNSAQTQPQTNPEPAKLKVSGYGIFGNRELKRILRTLELSGKKPPLFGSSFVEDSALILSARIKRDGYLKPAISIYLELEHGGHMHVTADELVDNPLPRPLRFKRAEFEIIKGRLYHYDSLEIEGLVSMTTKEARDYFMETDNLLHPRSARVYTPEKLKHGVASLVDVLERRGFADATAEVTKLEVDDRTGAAFATIKVNQGQAHIARFVREEFYYEGDQEPRTVVTVNAHKPYSKVWMQDFTQSLKTNLFHLGFPDASVELVVTNQTQTGANRLVLDLVAKVRGGPQVKIGDVKFSGEKRTRVSTMSRRVRVKRGELLDRIRVEEGRYRLAQLGAFSSVDLRYDAIDEHTRDVLYDVKEGKSLDVSLLFGYGSYELLRGGVEVEKNDVFGLGHHARLKATQSFKASSGEFTYTVPDLVGRDIDLFANASGLRREEVDFTRIEYGGGFGGHRYLKEYATDATLRYNYQILNAADVPGVVAAQSPTNTTVGSIIADVKYDRRDNPLYPRKGYKIFVNFEVASEYLAGEANYERLQFAASWHNRIGGGRFISLGVSQGVVVGGNGAKDLPFNRRFFPGGENSIRGYGEGEASPRDARGNFIGCEAYTLGTIELEQALTPQWSVVLFSDSLGYATSANDYPFNVGLYSVGLGLRWKTIIGPIRLEYGYNLNPRHGDPTGTLQFSLGFPF
jgi:outer membrane protein insertion porin family